MKGGTVAERHSGRVFDGSAQTSILRPDLLTRTSSLARKGNPSKKPCLTEAGGRYTTTQYVAESKQGNITTGKIKKRTKR